MPWTYYLYYLVVGGALILSVPLHIRMIVRIYYRVFARTSEEERRRFIIRAISEILAYMFLVYIALVFII